MTPSREVGDSLLRDRTASITPLFHSLRAAQSSAGRKRLQETISIQMITSIAVSRLTAMETNNQQSTKERNNNESNDSLQKNKNSSKCIPKPERDLRVSNNRSRAEPLRLS